MERKQFLPPSPLKLTETVIRDHPGAEVFVSFPDQWQAVHTFRTGGKPYYVAGFPPSQERARADHFAGLPPEINRTLTTYRLYKLFEPCHTPTFQMAWNSYIGAGQIIGGGRPRVQLQPRGQAQVWSGDDCAVLWETYLFGFEQRQSDWQQKLTQFWKAVENDIGVQTIFTQPHEPDFMGDYPAFLRGLGFEPLPEYGRWWYKNS